MDFSYIAIFDSYHDTMSSFSHIAELWISEIFIK